MTARPILTVNQLTLASAEKTLFTEISFELHTGEMLAVMGPSGIGKSMLSKAIAGFLPDGLHAQGQILFNGENVTERTLLTRGPDQRAAVIFQDALTALNGLARVEQQLTLALTGNQTRLSSVHKTQIEQLLQQLGFAQPQSTLQQYPSQLSGGQRQRICIAMALLGKANLLIADEPTSALDPITEAEILKLLQTSVKQKNIAGVLITHDLHAALACDKLLILDEGKMIAYGEPKIAIEQSQHGFCRQLHRLLP